MRKRVFTVGVLVVLLLAADRLAPRVAGSVVARQVRAEAGLASDPTVTFHGFPFLTQVVAGRYRDVQVTATQVRAGRLDGIDVDCRLRGLHVPLGDLIGGDLRQVPVDQVSGTARIGYDDLLRIADLPQGVTVDSVRPDGDGLRVHGTMQLAGQPVAASAIASVAVSVSTLLVTANHVTFENLPGPAPDLSGLADRLSFRVPIGDLPFHLRPTDVRAAEDGLHLHAQARDVVLG